MVYYYFFIIYFNMKYIMLLCKGLIIGIAKIIPGVSGAIIAMSFGVYERLVSIMSKPTKIRLNDLKFLFFLLVGAAIGVGVISKGVKWCLNEMYFSTMLLFSGLIIGGLSDVIDGIKKDGFRVTNILVFIICFSLVYYLVNLNSLSISLNNNFLFFFIGIIESLTTVIPGISGTAIFMAFGWYEQLLDIFDKMTSFNFDITILIFLLGFIISTVMVSKFITWLFNSFKSIAYTGVLAFMISSLLIMGEKAFSYSFSIFDFILGIFLFIVGIIGTKKINYLFSKFSN